MTRREWLATAVSGAAAQGNAAPLRTPVLVLIDTRSVSTPMVETLWRPIWLEAVRDLERGGIPIEVAIDSGEVKRTASGAPVFVGLRRGFLNVVVTMNMPVNWDLGRGLNGVSTRYEGHELAVIALAGAHRHQIPFLSVNTCLHELLHLLLGDVFEKRPSGFKGEAREFRVDTYATRLWLFGDGRAIRGPAQRCAARLQSQSVAVKTR